MSEKRSPKNFIRYKKGYKAQFIKTLLIQIEQGESFCLLGMPGIGKTDMFQTLNQNRKFWQELFPKKKINFLITVLDLTKLLNVSPLGFYRLLLSELHTTASEFVNKTNIQQKLKKIHDKARDSRDMFIIYKAIEDIIKILVYKEKLKLCILIDDFSTLANFQKQFFNSLKSLRNLNKWKIILAFSSNRDLLTTTKPEVLDELYDLFINKTIWLKPFSKQDAFLAMKRWKRERGISLSAEAKTRIYEISGGHPGYMRALCRVFLDSKKDMSIFDTTNIANLARNDIITARSRKFWNQSLNKYKTFLTQFVQNPQTQIDQEAHYLKDVGMILDKNNSTTIFSPLLKHFIESQIKSHNSNTKDVPIKQGTYIDPETKTIYVNGKILQKEPTSNEYRIFQLLYKNKGEIVNRDKLAHTLWGPNDIEKYSDWAIDQTISRIRNKLGDSARNPKFIQTIKGRGLRLIA